MTVFVDQQILEILNKKAISTVPTKHMEGQFLSTLFLVLKKDRPSNSHKFKKANQHIRYEHLKMEGLSLFKEILQEVDCMCKIDPADAYFSAPLHPDFLKSF